jgi:hypothetical protein
MNFLSFRHFLDFQTNNQILFTPNRFLTLDIDMWGQTTCHLPRWQDQVKRIDWEGVIADDRRRWQFRGSLDDSLA